VCDLETSRMGAPYIYIYIYIYDISRLRVKLITWNQFIRCAFGITRHGVNLTVVSDSVPVYFCSVRDDRELRSSVVRNAHWISLEKFPLSFIPFWCIKTFGFHVSCFPLNLCHIAKECAVLKYLSFPVYCNLFPAYESTRKKKWKENFPVMLCYL